MLYNYTRGRFLENRRESDKVRKKNATSGKFEEADKAAKFTGKTLVTDGKKIFGIVINKSNFE